MRLAAFVVPDRALDRLVRACDLAVRAGPARRRRSTTARWSASSRAGAVAIGLALADRADGCWRLMTRAGEPWTSLGDAWLDARTRRCAGLAHGHRRVGPDATFRLVHGAGDALPGLFADRLRRFAVVSALTPALVPVAGALARRLVARGLADGAVVKHRAAARRPEAEVVVEVAGTAPPDRLVVREGRWRFEVHLARGVNVGLFGDMRAERLRLAGSAPAGACSTCSPTPAPCRWRRRPAALHT